MRQIEKNMNSAIWSKKNWTGSNTTVITEDNVSAVMLHGNHIATYYHNTKELALFDGGWQSNTTKSRLNALCNEFATGFGVFQKNWEWFISDFSNNKKEFDNGITVNYNGCW